MSGEFKVSALGERVKAVLCWRRLWLAPAVFLLMAVAGTVLGASGARPTVAILEFRVAVGGAPADFGLAAARLLTQALQTTGRYTIINQSAVQDQVRSHGLRPPFGVGHLQLLSDALGADLVVHGSVRGLTYDAEAGSASVLLLVEVVDGQSGELKSRLQVSGTRSAQVGVRADFQDILAEALANAARSVAEKLTGAQVRGAPRNVSGAEVPSELPIRAPLLPAMAAAVDSPKNGIPRRDLSIVAEPSTPGPVVAVAGQPVSESADHRVSLEPASSKPREAVAQPVPETITPEPLAEDHQPLIRVKILAKLGPRRVLITLGRDAIVSPKMELDVFRVRYSRDTKRMGKSRIGKIRVVKINPTDAEARILEGGDLIRTGDLGYYYGE